MKNGIVDLRNHLFATLEALQDEDNPMDIARAKTIAEVASVIVESAKAETKHMEVTGHLSGSGFIPAGEREGGALSRGGDKKPRLVDAGK